MAFTFFAEISQGSHKLTKNEKKNSHLRNVQLIQDDSQSAGELRIEGVEILSYAKLGLGRRQARKWEIELVDDLVS